MYIFSAESSIAELISKNKTIAFHTKLSQSLDTKEEVKKIAKASRDINLNDEDLAYLDSILASVGYNGNDDLFTKEDIWLARNSPINKQFNFMHNQRDIIGHMFASNIFDIEGNQISESTPFDEIPDNFDIVVSSVLYKSWPQPELQERMDSILKGIANNEWYVSMEAYFKAFDYALVHKNKEIEIISRNKTTAYMSRYLRAYGGSGEYNSIPIKRVLRRFSFSGKGLVDCPANERSVIFDNIERLKKYSIANITKKENNMDELEMAKAELVKAKADIDAGNVKIQTLASQVDSVTTQLTEAKTEVSNLTKAKVEIEKTVEEVKADLQKANEELVAVKAEKVKSDRVNKLIKAGIVDTAEIESIFAEWQNVSETQFEKVVALHVKNKAQAVMTDEEKETEEEKMAECAKASLDKDNVEKDKDTTLAVETEDLTSKVIATASAWLSTTLNNKKKEGK